MTLAPASCTLNDAAQSISFGDMVVCRICERMMAHENPERPRAKILVASLLLVGVLAAMLLAWRSGFMHYALSKDHLVAMLRADEPGEPFFVLQPNSYKW